MTSVVGAVVTSIVAVVLSASPVSADGELGLSVDGVTWADDVTTPLFDPSFVWVPGDLDVATLYLRNQSDGPATGIAEVTLGPGGADLRADLDVRTRFDGGTWTAGLTSPTISVAPDEVVRFEIEVTFDPASTNRSQLEEVPLTVRVRLSGENAAIVEPPSTPGGPLPITGVELARTLTAAALLVVIGMWLVNRRRATGGG